jgi:hypothetical protein
MLKFFRKIRYDLMDRNKTGKYVKYAIGEVFLVVIGILIALQINNWNEARKETVREVKMLQDISNDIQKNIANIEEGIVYLDQGKISSINVLKYIEAKQEYTDSMLTDFTNFTSFWDPDFTEASFENLKNVGVNLISNDTLRNRIIGLFEIDMDILDVSDLNSHNSYMSAVADPVFSHYFYYNWKSLENINERILLNYEKMKADQQFYSICSRLLLDQEIALRKSNAFIEKSKLLNAAIEKQIDLLQ